MARPIRADIRLSALQHNYAAAKRAAPRSRALAVVKANAYGHGLDRVARALAHADGFATLELDGAVRLRESGFAGEILLLEGFFEAGELAEIAGRSLATVVASEEHLRLLEAHRPPTPVDCYLKINTGMNRLGLAPSAVRPALERLRTTGATKSVTLMTHFATADGPQGIGEAMRRFDEATRGIDLPRSLANSAAIFAHPEAQADTVREGIALYGATPFAEFEFAFVERSPNRQHPWSQEFLT